MIKKFIFFISAIAMIFNTVGHKADAEELLSPGYQSTIEFWNVHLDLKRDMEDFLSRRLSLERRAAINGSQASRVAIANQSEYFNNRIDIGSTMDYGTLSGVFTPDRGMTKYHLRNGVLFLAEHKEGNFDILISYPNSIVTVSMGSRYIQFNPSTLSFVDANLPDMAEMLVSILGSGGGISVKKEATVKMLDDIYMIVSQYEKPRIWDMLQFSYDTLSDVDSRKWMIKKAEEIYSVK